MATWKEYLQVVVRKDKKRENPNSMNVKNSTHNSIDGTLQGPHISWEGIEDIHNSYIGYIVSLILLNLGHVFRFRKRISETI